MIDAVKIKIYGFMAIYPGLGLGGHCFPFDPFYLTWKAREFNYNTQLIKVAGEINQRMPEYVVEHVFELLNRKKKAVQGSRIAILGVA